MCLSSNLRITKKLQRNLHFPRYIAHIFLPLQKRTCIPEWCLSLHKVVACHLQCKRNLHDIECNHSCLRKNSIGFYNNVIQDNLTYLYLWHTIGFIYFWTNSKNNLQIYIEGGVRYYGERYLIIFWAVKR